MEKLKLEYTNQHGEKMTLLYNDIKTESTLFKHSDIENVFEDLESIKYILDKGEKKVIQQFIKMTKELNKTIKKKI